MRWLTLTALLMALLSCVGDAYACTPPPPPHVKPAPHSVVDRAVRRLFAEAEYVAEVKVLRPPGFRHIGENAEPSPGLLEVRRAIKGAPANLIQIPLPDPCALYFRRVGQIMIVSRAPNNQPMPLDERVVASMRRQHLGRWPKAR